MAVWPYNTARWRRLRALKLATDPLCEVHPDGRLVPADTVDHNISIAAGGDPFPALDGLTSMCVSCHSRKTRYQDTPGQPGGQQARVPAKGCNADGTPRDPSHWWNET